MLNKTGPKILLIDIETAPNLVYSWGLWDQNISIDQIFREAYVLCWSAKWIGSKEMFFDSIFRHKETFRKDKTDDKHIAQSAWEMMNEADIIIGHNADNFDIKWLNTIFLKHKLKPVSPFKTIDTLKVARNNFNFQSNKLDFISKSLGVGQKLKHEGFPLWTKCMAGDSNAWKIMEEYNKKDVEILEEVYEKLKPYIKNHPNLALYTNMEAPSCPNCLSKNLTKRGIAYTKNNRYQRYQCNDCGRWIRANHSLINKDQKEQLRGNY